VLLTEGWVFPRAVLNNAIMNGPLVAVLWGYVSACRGYAICVLRIHVIQKAKISGRHLLT
jgi:hypothetical protein